MKIYHTETQADYDALMVELEKQGCKWLSGRKPTEAKYHWFNYEEKTCVRVSSGFLTKFDFRHSKEEYPDTPITKYKAKVDEKMKFTKENVEKVINEYFWQADFESCGDLIAAIDALDDTPGKVVVPKFVAEWIEWNKETGADLQTMLRCYRHYYNNINSYSESDGKKAVQWYVDNPYKFIQAYEEGYTIEPEKLYYIPLPDLKTSDGIQQVLSKRKGDKHYFASRPVETLQQRFTKEELEQVPEIYKPYAKLIEEEAND